MTSWNAGKTAGVMEGAKLANQLSTDDVLRQKNNLRQAVQQDNCPTCLHKSQRKKLHWTSISCLGYWSPKLRPGNGNTESKVQEQDCPHHAGSNAVEQIKWSTATASGVLSVGTLWTLTKLWETMGNIINLCSLGMLLDLEA